MDTKTFNMDTMMSKTTYRSIERRSFEQFCQTYKFRLSSKTDLSTLYHVIFWLYHQFKSYKEFYGNFQNHNGFEIFEKCKEEYSPNCACFSIMLNDILIAMGYKSKAVWCLSSDPLDDECHALNHVWIEELNKWVVADPSSRSVICDELGTPIDLMTMRTRIYNDGIVYPYRNKTICQSAEFIKEYNLYMKKNSFQFLTHIEQGLHYPLDQNAVLIHPIGYLPMHERDWHRTTDISYLF